MATICNRFSVRRLLGKGGPALSLCTALCLFGISHAAAEEILIQHGDVAVSEAEFAAYVRARIPEARRAEAFARPNAAREMLANLFVVKMLASEARSAGLDREPEVAAQLALAQDLVLSEEHLNRVVLAGDQSDWQALARETYLASGERFVQPDRVRASHILVGVEGRSEAEARARSEEIMARLKNGEDLSALAREYSDDPSAASNGGSLGAFTRDRMVPEFADAAFALSEPGELAGPVRTQFGFHIIRLDAKLPGGRLPFERVQDQLVAELRAEHDKVARQREVSRVRSLAGIRVNDEAVQRLEEAYRSAVEAAPARR